LKNSLNELFYPRSIAVAGVSNSITGSLISRFYLQPLIDFGYSGEIYPVHPREKELLGLRVFPSITDIPGPVDYVVSAIPAHKVPQLMEECIAREVKLISFYTAGFSESGDDVGLKLEATLLEIARRGNIRILGPNCMGIYCPESRVSFDSTFPRENGKVAFISQSGGVALYVCREATSRGVSFSKVVSYGNASDINETELLQYLAQDDATKVIAAYIEGIKGGRKFLQALREASAVKPVIVLKGGSTEAGARGVMSHTASLAGTDIIWDAAFNQWGVVRVFSPEEMIDMMVAFSHPHTQGKRVAIIGFGGGASVQAADDCEKAGLSVPLVPQSVREKLGKLALVPGSIFKNPIDMVGNFANPEEFDQTIRIVSEWEDVDFLLTHLVFGVGGLGYEDLKLHVSMLQQMIDVAKTINKQVIFALDSTSSPVWQKESYYARQKCIAAGFPVYSSIRHAAQAIGRIQSLSKSYGSSGDVRA